MRRVVVLLAVAALAAIGAVVVAQRDAADDDRAAGGPLAYSPAREAQLAAAAARGHAHVLYAKSPGGAPASARRTARYRSLVEIAARAAGIGADTLEAMVLLESAGRPDAVADPQLEGAVGLTQILAETGRNLLGMRVDPAAARALGRSIARAQRRGDSALVERLRARRRIVDERFDPPKALAATARYLTIALDELGDRRDLAVVSYHMGIGNLQGILDAYGDDDVSYARLYFDSTPQRHGDAWQRLARLGDDSSTYLWRVGAARAIMRLHRSDPAELERLARLQTAKSSAEEVLHPRSETERFETAEQLRDAYDDGRLVRLDAATAERFGLRIDPGMGELAPRLGRSKATYRGLRRPALALLAQLGERVRELSGSAPLVVTSTVRDAPYQRLLVARNREATRNYSLHTTGWAFDVLRSYRSRAQARAFEFMLGRLQSLDLIAWVREPAAIHVTVSHDAERLVDAVGLG